MKFDKRFERAILSKYTKVTLPGHSMMSKVVDIEDALQAGEVLLQKIDIAEDLLYRCDILLSKYTFEVDEVDFIKEEISDFIGK